MDSQTSSLKQRSLVHHWTRKKREEVDNTNELTGELFDAISEGNTRLVALVLKEAKKVHNLLEKKDLQGLTPLKKAIALNKADIARVLVTSGASPNVRDPVGKTPLHIAVMQGRRELVAPLLVSVDSSVNVQDKAGWTPLHYAIRGKHLKVLEWLLYAGADVNLKNKNDLSPLEMTEEDSLMRKMLEASNIDRDLYPVILSSAFISRKSLNYIGTDRHLMFVTSQNWSASDQFFFCKRIRPSEAHPQIPLRWNEYFYSDVYHYRTMRRLNEKETRVKLYILFFGELTQSEIVLKITSKEKFLGEVPLQCRTYIQDNYINFMGSCEMDIKPEGQFVIVKRHMSIHLRRNEDGVMSCKKYPNFMFDLPQGAVPSPSKDWNSTRKERAMKERDRLMTTAQQVISSLSQMDDNIIQEYYEKTYVQEAVPEETGKSPPLASPPKSPPVLKLEKSGASTESFTSHLEAEKPELPVDDQASKIFSEAIMSETVSEIVPEPMLEAYEPDNCEDFYYISKGWGLYLTVMQAFPLSVLLSSAARERMPIRCSTDFYHLSHTAEQHPKSDCMVQIPKTDDFIKKGTVLVFARKNVAPEDESPEPDDSPQEYLISDDMKTFWGVFWQNQERDRWNLINAGIVNKHTRVIFKTRIFSTFIVIQLMTGDERSEKEEDDEESSDDEEDHAPPGEEEEGEKDEKTPIQSEGGEEGEYRLQEGGEAGRRRGRKAKKRKKSNTSTVLALDDQMCLRDEADSEEEEIPEQGEGEGEDGGDEKGTGDGAEGRTEGAGPPPTDGTEDTGEPGAPAPSPMINKEEIKDDNTSNATRSLSPLVDRTGNSNNNTTTINKSTASANKNNNKLRVDDDDDDYDQSSLSPEERTIVVGLPSAPSSFAKLSIVPSVYRGRSLGKSETEEGTEPMEGEAEASSGSEFKSMTHTTDIVSGVQDEGLLGQDLGAGTKSKSTLEQEEEHESDEDLPTIRQKKLSISVTKNGVRKLQDFKFGPKLNSLPLPGVDIDQVKTDIALMWRYRNHKQTSVLIFSRPRGEGEFDMIVDVVKSLDTYVRAESHYSVGFKMVGESHPLTIKTGRFMSFTIEGPLIVEKCEGGVTPGQGTLRTRTLYFCHSQINSLEYTVKRPQVEEVKGPTTKKGKKKEEVKVETEPDARLEVMGFNAGSGTNGVDLAVLPIWLTGPDLWHDRHVNLRISDNKLLNLLVDCLTKSRALARNWWRLLILLGYPEKDVEKEKGKTPPNVVVGTYVMRWFDDSLNSYDRGILKLIQALDILNLDVAIDNVVRIIKIYKAHLLKEPVRPRYLKLLFHWVLQTKITRNNLLHLPDPPILRPVSDVFLLYLSNFLPKHHLFKVGAAMEVEENVLHAIAGEEIICDEAYLGFRVLVKSRQKKDEIIHYTLLLLEMFKQVELPDASEFMVRETKKWMETLSDSDIEICNKLENLFA